MSFRSFSVIFFAGITTLSFSSSSASELELLSDSDSSFLSCVNSSLLSVSTSSDEELFSGPVSGFFLHPPEGLGAGLSLEWLTRLLDSSLTSKSQVDDVTVDDVGRLNLPANEDLKGKGNVRSHKATEIPQTQHAVGA